MNERIRELAGQALDQAVPQTWTTLTVSDLTKFTEKLAELIVQECATVLDDKLANPNGANMAYCDGSDLLEHFGVEEDSKGWVCSKCGVDRTKDVCPLGHMAAVTGTCPMIATAHGVEQ